MEVTLKRFGIDGLFVKPEGRLDLDNAVIFGTKVKDAIEDNEIKNVILDLEDVTFMSSFGLKVLLELHNAVHKEGSLKLKNVSGTILKTFKLVGFDKFLDIEDV